LPPKTKRWQVGNPPKRFPLSAIFDKRDGRPIRKLIWLMVPENACGDGPSIGFESDRRAFKWALHRPATISDS